MNEQRLEFADLLEAFSLLAAALGKSANLQTIGSRSVDPPDIPVTIFLRDQKRNNPRVVLVFPEHGEQKRRSSSYDLIYVVPRVSARTEKEWRATGQSFIDLHGLVFVEIPGLVVDRRVHPNQRPRALQSSQVDPFADRASLIPRLMLNTPPGKSWGIRELASLTTVSLGTASKIVNALERRQLVTVSRKGRTAKVSVRDPALLFQSWVSAYSWTRNALLPVSAPIADLHVFVKLLPRKLGPVTKKWALTMHAAAARIARHAVWHQVHLYVDASEVTDLEAIAADLNWTPAPDGSLTLMRPYYRDTIWRSVERQADVFVVDNLQVALDLWHYPQRGREQAELVLRRKLPWIVPKRD